MRKLLSATVALATLAAVPALASSDPRCPEAPRAEWQSPDAIRARLEGMGYKVRKVETERNCYEVEGTDANGAEFEAYVNPRTGEIVPARQGDDD